MSLPTPDTRLAELEHLDWTPGCQHDPCESVAVGVYSHPPCGFGFLLCDAHHLQELAELADDLAVDGDGIVVCLSCDRPITSLADVEWRPL